MRLNGHEVRWHQACVNLPLDLMEYLAGDSEEIVSDFYSSLHSSKRAVYFLQKKGTTISERGKILQT